MEEKIYKKARLKAAKTNPELETVEKTYSQLFMSREKLLKIEQNDPKKKMTDPTPQDVVEMAKLYAAPELCDYYCTHQCPIGQGRKPLMHENLSEISTSLMSALHFLNTANDKIHRILSDSKITMDEKEEFKKILTTLNDIAYSAESLKLWATKNKIIE